jgi:hypothetical protein
MSDTKYYLGEIAKVLNDGTITCKLYSETKESKCFTLDKDIVEAMIKAYKDRNNK